MTPTDYLRRVYADKKPKRLGLDAKLFEAFKREVGAEGQVIEWEGIDVWLDPVNHAGWVTIER